MAHDLMHLGPLSLWVLTIGVIVALVFTVGKLILDERRANKDDEHKK